MSVTPTVVVHGGAGFVAPERRPERERACAAAARMGLEAMREGGSALDAVTTSVAALEDDPLFNAGHGAALTYDGEVELDASLMDGGSLRSGAVAALPPFDHPIRIARAVLEEGEHVFYVAHGAARFAWDHGFAPAAPDALVTEGARARLAAALRDDGAKPWAGGTVGAVALDASGHLAAATSTGGTVAKRAGRVGDSPVIGAGTYADDKLGACSVTGDGEAALRQLTALLACLAVAGGELPEDAAKRVLEALEREFGGLAGLILLGPKGEVGVGFRTQTMSHAIAREGKGITTGH